MIALAILTLLLAGLLIAAVGHDWYVNAWRQEVRRMTAWRMG